jgi:hypothetical protein
LLEKHLNTSAHAAAIKQLQYFPRGSNIAESHDLSFLTAVKQDLPQMSREGLQIIFTELLYGIVNNNNRPLGKYINYGCMLKFRPRQVRDHLHVTQI